VLPKRNEMAKEQREKPGREAGFFAPNEAKLECLA